jgi:hypothetical protein
MVKTVNAGSARRLDERLHAINVELFVCRHLVEPFELSIRNAVVLT